MCVYGSCWMKVATAVKKFAARRNTLLRKATEYNDNDSRGLETYKWVLVFGFENKDTELILKWQSIGIWPTLMSLRKPAFKFVDKMTLQLNSLLRKDTVRCEWAAGLLSHHPEL